MAVKERDVDNAATTRPKPPGVAEAVVAAMSEYGNSGRGTHPEALEAARNWAAGKIKMREAQRKILDCHGLAKELSSPADAAACHAVGQACSVVHTAGHAMGYPIYDLTAIVYRLGLENCREQVERRKEEYVDRLLWWAGRPEKDAGEWAGFLGG